MKDIPAARTSQLPSNSIGIYWIIGRAECTVESSLAGVDFNVNLPLQSVFSDTMAWKRKRRSCQQNPKQQREVADSALEQK